MATVSSPEQSWKGVAVKDWKFFLAIAGGSFFANLVALIAVVSVMLAPVKVSIANNTKANEMTSAAIEKVSDRQREHVSSTMHPGTVETIKRLDAQMGAIRTDVEWIRDRLEKGK